MKVVIESSDRIGISQEILSIFANKSWNVKAIEVEQYFTFVHLEASELTINEVFNSLQHITGVKDCQQIELMPSEVREQHLQALLARIPDPIIDLDKNGLVLGVNEAANTLLFGKNEIVIGQHIEQYCDLVFTDIKNQEEHSIQLNFSGQHFVADINPVNTRGQFSGAVVSVRSLNKLGRQIALMQGSSDNAIESIIGDSETINLVKSQALRFAELDLPVLISGETGTGKELFAKALHQSSPRKDHPFLSINCATLPEHLLESELFGYESGAFTGANKGGKPGLIELAQGGTIFLDEIAEMSVYLQAKLLRFIQDYKFRRVGGTKEIVADVKLVSASHQNFSSLIEQGHFREDLYYRLNVLRIELPPLHKRTDDIPQLLEHFLDKAARQVNQHKPVLVDSAVNLLINYQWPGNIRQLENTIFRLVALNNKPVIDFDSVKAVLQGSSEEKTPGQHNVESDITDWASAQASFEKQLLTDLYPLYPTTRKLAQRLNVSHNKIAMKLRAYNIK